MNRLAAVVLCVVIAGCAETKPDPAQAMRWTKSAGSYDEFMKDRYGCAQEASRQRTDGYVNKYGGQSQSRPVVSLGLFQSCMGARGWQQSSEGYVAPTNALILMED